MNAAPPRPQRLPAPDPGRIAGCTFSTTGVMKGWVLEKADDEFVIRCSKTMIRESRSRETRIAQREWFET